MLPDVRGPGAGHDQGGPVMAWLFVIGAVLGFIFCPVSGVIRRLAWCAVCGVAMTIVIPLFPLPPALADALENAGAVTPGACPR